MNKWSDTDMGILKNLYPTKGAKHVASLVNRHWRAVTSMAFNSGIKYNKNLPIPQHYLDKFYNITEPDIAYFLGYFWADGYISDKGNIINFGIVEKDGLELKDFILKIAPFHISISRPKTRPNQQKTMSFHKGDKSLHKFLSGHDFGIKSNESPRKILSKIPKSLHCFWWQGYLDGDGCLYLNKSGKNIHPRIQFSGPVEQDWSFYEDLCKELDIRYYHLKQENDLGFWSNVYIQTITECRKFLDYIYKNGHIGLTRKYNKYLELKENVEIPKPKTSKYIGVCKKAIRETKNWYAFACHSGRFHSIGFYFTEEDAARARDKFVVDNNLPLKLNFKD